MLAAVDRETFVAGHLIGDLNLAAVHRENGVGTSVGARVAGILEAYARPFGEHSHLGGFDSPRVEVGGSAVEQNHAFVLAEGIDHVKHVLVNIYRPGVPLAHGVRGVHGANQGAVFGVDELVGSATGSADIDQVGGGFGVRPVPAVGAAA